MPDWTASMQQTFEYYIVDPKSWRDINDSKMSNPVLSVGIPTQIHLAPPLLNCQKPWMNAMSESIS